MTSGLLVLVGTPIGNLGDLSPRAADALASADVIACEDTRRCRALLSHCGIPAGRRLTSFHAHNEATRIPVLLDALAGGSTVALVTDAGMPGISDPGSRLVRAVAESGGEVTVVPGPSAVITALVVSGLDTSSFLFVGFLPRGGGARAAAISAIAESPVTVVLYESPQRIGTTLSELARHLERDAPRDTGATEVGQEPGRTVCVARELTKLHEELWRGTLDDAARHFAAAEVRGEVVVVLSGAGRGPRSAACDSAEIARMVADVMASGVGRRDAARVVADRTGVSKRFAYETSMGRA